MKNIFFPVILIMISSQCFAQSLHVGIKAGANINQITGQTFSNEFTYGYHAGAFAILGLGKKLSIRPEVLFSESTVDTSSQYSSIYHLNNVSHIDLDYLSIPVLLQYKVSNVLSLQAGPQYGIMINKNNTLVQNGQAAFKSGDFGVLGGVELKILGFSVYGRYVVGLNNINQLDNRDNWKSQTIQVGVGYAIF